MPKMRDPNASNRSTKNFVWWLDNFCGLAGFLFPFVLDRIAYQGRGQGLPCMQYADRLNLRDTKSPEKNRGFFASDVN